MHGVEDILCLIGHAFQCRTGEMPSVGTAGQADERATGMRVRCLPIDTVSLKSSP